MPRPKRSKVVSSTNPAPRAPPASTATKPTPAQKPIADDIEDEEERPITSTRRLPRTNPRRAAEVTRTIAVAVNAEYTHDGRKGKGRGKQAAENSGNEDEEEANDGAPAQEATTPSIEMSRRESIIPTVETSVRRRGKQPGYLAKVRKALDANDIVSSIGSDIATVPTVLPRMENTILGQPTFRGRARQRAPSILGKGAGAARARSSSMGLEMAGASNSSAPGTEQSIRFSAVGGTFKRRERQPSILGSNRKKMLMQQAAEQSDQGQDEDMDDFNDFNPDDESTPLHAQKMRSAPGSNPSSSAIPVSTSSSRKRRKISEIQVPRSPSLPLTLKKIVYGESLTALPRTAENQIVRKSQSGSSNEQDIYGVSSPSRSRPIESQNVRQSPGSVNEDIYDISSDVRRRLAELQNAQTSFDEASPQLIEPQIVQPSQSRSVSPDIQSPASIRSNITPEPPNETDAQPQSSSPATPTLPTTRLQDPNSETNAPPRSSSPVTPTFPTARIPAIQHQIPAASRSRRVLATQDSPISSPPSLTYSPNYKPATKPAKQPAGKKAKPEVPLTTAALQNLLPQRRRTRRGRRDKDELSMSSEDEEEEEVDVSGLKSDDDELSYLDAPARRARTRTPGLGKGRAKTPASASTKATSKKPVQKAKQSAKATGKTTVAKGRQKSKRTYGSANKVDDEENDKEEEEEEEDESLEPDANDTPEDENSQELEERIGKELKRLKRKFEVVDEWEMEFEDVQVNSSEDRRMADAR